MNKNTKIILGIVLVVVILGVIVLTKQDDEMVNKKMDDSSVVEKDDATEVEIATEEGMVEAGSYEEYALEKISRAETGDVVLFFHASWCPSCRGLNSDIEKNMGAIPEDLSILKLDYDKETDLKIKYGVTYQHTLVQVDKNGELIKKWSGSPTLERLVSEIE